MKATAALAIINFVWQGAAIGLVAWLGFALSRSPRIRYLIGVAALALMAAAPVATIALIAQRTAVPGAAVNVQGSPEVEVAATRSGGEALRQGTQSSGESGTATVASAWLNDRLSDPRVASMVLVVWLIGVVALSTRLALGWLGARRLTRHVTAARRNVQAIANRLVESLRIRSTVRVVESALVKVPAVVGAFKPVVLLPAAAMSGLSMEQVEALLAHELAHVRRHDYLVNLLQSAVETLLFYHPAVWLVSSRVRQDRELCCDDLALAVCSDRVAYASALADLESLRAVPSPALAATGGSLLTRVRRILGHDDVSALSGRSKSLAGVAILATLILLAGGQAARDHSLLAAGEEIVAADGTGGLRSPNAPQIPGPVVGAQAAAQGATAGGTQGGVPASVPILVSANDDPALKIPEDTDITVRVKSNGKAVKQFNDKPLHVGKDGFVVLPLIGRYPLAGKSLREAASAIRGELIFKKLLPDPEVDVRANMEIVAAEPMEISPEPLAPTVQAGVSGIKNVPQDYVIGVDDEVVVNVAVPVPQPEFSIRPYRVQADGTIRLPRLAQPQKIAGLNVAQARQAIRQALIDAKQFENPIVDVSMVRLRSAGYEFEVAPEPQQPAGPPVAVGQIVRLEVSVGQVRQAEFNKDYTVQPDGTIVVPYIGSVKAAGLSATAIANSIASSLNASNTLPGAKVAASVETRQLPPPPPPAPKPISVTVQGAIRAPGNVVLREDRNSLSDALSAAGGFQSGAGARIFLRRSNAPDRTFSKSALVQGEYANIKLQDGDGILVEFAPHFYVTGYVKNSAAEFNWDTGMTLQKAIAMAGGVSPEGAGNRITIERKDPKTGKFAPVKLDKTVMSTPIEPGDVIRVPKKRI